MKTEDSYLRDKSGRFIKGCHLGIPNKYRMGIKPPNYVEDVSKLNPIHARVRTRKKVESILGKELPFSAVIHHIDENPLNAENNNLVVCSRLFHSILHQRLNALKAGFPVYFIKCGICGNFDDPANMLHRNNKKQSVFNHKEYEYEYYRKHAGKGRKSRKN